MVEYRRHGPEESGGATNRPNRKKQDKFHPVSRPVEQIYYFGGWGEVVKSICCQGFAYKQTDRTDRTGVGEGVHQPCFKTCVLQVKIVRVNQFQITMKGAAKLFY